MNTTQISSILRRCSVTSTVFRGVYPSDYINKQNGSGIFVVNTHPSHMPGEHWIVICIEEHSGKGLYFDSFGLPPQKSDFIHFLNTNTSGWTYNTKPIQHPFSSVCGHYCVLFALHFAKNRTLSEFLLMFGNNLLDNDKLVHEYISNAFNIHVDLIDVELIVNQFGFNYLLSI